MKTLIEEYGVFIISLFTVIIVLLMSTTFTRKAETSSKYALGDFEAQYEQRVNDPDNPNGTGGSGGTGNEGGENPSDPSGGTGNEGGENPSNPNTSTITHIHDYSITTFLQEPTCTEKGYEIQKCSKCSKQQTVEIKALEHNWEGWKTITQPTCTVNGLEKNKCLRCAYIDTSVLNALGHKYNTKTYTWASNGSTCSGKTICENDSSHVVTEQATVTTTVKTQPTCTTKGTHTYTANFSNSLFTQQVKDLVDMDILGHNWGTPTYTWSSTGSTCTAKRVCTRDSSHVEQQNATISSTVTVAATCTTAGKHKYTATFTNSAFTTQTKEIQDIPLLGHSYSSTYTIDVQPTCTTQGSKSRHCTRCDAKGYITTIDKLGHQYGDDGTCSCGSKQEAGLYTMDNVLKKTWQQLIDERIIVVNNGTIGSLYYGMQNESMPFLSGKLVISDKINHISNQAFRHCNFLEAVIMPNSISSIGERSFYECMNLKNVVLSDNLHYINESAFGECDSLESITMPSVQIIGTAAFHRCTSLKTVNLSSNLVKISEMSFDTCTSLESINIPDGVTFIGYRAFADCENLRVIMPSNIDTVEYQAFSNVLSIQYK